MAREVITSLNVDSTVLFLPPDAIVYDWVRDRTKEIARNARRLCPPGRSMGVHGIYKSSGRMRSTIRSATTYNGAKLDFGIIAVGPTIDPTDRRGHDYTLDVLTGTAHQGMRYIYSSRGFANKATIDAVITRRGIVRLGIGQLVVKSDLPSSWVMRFRNDGSRHYRVHGQRKNPFMTDAWNRVAARHPDSMGIFATPFG